MRRGLASRLAFTRSDTRSMAWKSRKPPELRRPRSAGYKHPFPYFYERFRVDGPYFAFRAPGQKAEESLPGRFEDALRAWAERIQTACFVDVPREALRSVSGHPGLLVHTGKRRSTYYYQHGEQLFPLRKELSAAVMGGQTLARVLATAKPARAPLSPSLGGGREPAAERAGKPAPPKPASGTRPTVPLRAASAAVPLCLARGGMQPISPAKPATPSVASVASEAHAHGQ